MGHDVKAPRLTGTYQIIGPWWRLWVGTDGFIDYDKPSPIIQKDRGVIVVKTKLGTAMFHCSHNGVFYASKSFWHHISAFEPTETTKL